MITNHPPITNKHWLSSFSAMLALPVALAITVGTASASLLIQVDVDAFNAPPGDTQAGFTRMSEPTMLGTANGSFVPTATVDGVTITAYGATGFRDRGIGPLAAEPNAELLRDLIQNVNGPDATIRVEIANLPAGLYDVTTFTLDWNVWNPGQPYSIYVDDANGTNQFIRSTTFTSALPYNGESFQITSDGVSTDSIYIVGIGTNPAKFNGMIIAGVPEPGTALLLGIGCLGIAAMRRRAAAR